MRDPLTLAVAQPPTAPYDVGRNALAHAAAVRAAAARVVVFPELSLTGYELDASAITPGDPRLAPILDACAETGTTALVGAPVQGERGRPYIAMLAVDDGGARVAYRKMHLGGDEPDRYAPGAAPAVLEVAGWRLGLAICRDTGIGGHAAETVALGVDAYVAGTVKLPQESALQDEPGRTGRRRAADLGGGGELRRCHRWRLRPGGGALRDLGARWPAGGPGRHRARRPRPR